MNEETYRIKPLEWSALQEDCISSECVARSEFGMFEVRRNHRGEWRYLAQLNGRWESFVDCDSLEDGKAKCAAAYRSHLLSALEPVPCKETT